MVNIVDDTEQIIVNVSGSTENLAAYTLVPGQWLSVNPATRVNFVNLPRNASPYPYCQSPAKTLTDFELRYHVHEEQMQDPATGGQGTNYSGGFVTALLTRQIGIINWNQMACINGTGNLGDGFGLSTRSLWVGSETQPKHIFAAYNHDNGVCPNPPPGTDRYEFVYWKGAPNTSPPIDIYVRLLKTGTTATLWLYSDANYSQLLLDAAGVPFPSAGRLISNIRTDPYSYLIACGCRGSGDGLTTTGYMEQFQVLF